MQSPLTKKEKYATTLPSSKENAATVKLYCLINHITIHEFTNQLIEKELKIFKKQIEELRKTRAR